MCKWKDYIKTQLYTYYYGTLRLLTACGHLVGQITKSSKYETQSPHEGRYQMQEKKG